MVRSWRRSRDNQARKQINSRLPGTGERRPGTRVCSDRRRLRSAAHVMLGPRWAQMPPTRPYARSSRLMAIVPAGENDIIAAQISAGGVRSMSPGSGQEGGLVRPSRRFCHERMSAVGAEARAARNHRAPAVLPCIARGRARNPQPQRERWQGAKRERLAPISTLATRRAHRWRVDSRGLLPSGRMASISS